MPSLHAIARLSVSVDGGVLKGHMHVDCMQQWKQAEILFLFQKTVSSDFCLETKGIWLHKNKVCRGAPLPDAVYVFASVNHLYGRLAGQRILFDGSLSAQLPPVWTGKCIDVSLTCGLSAQHQVHSAICENWWQFLFFSKSCTWTQHNVNSKYVWGTYSSGQYIRGFSK